MSPRPCPVCGAALPAARRTGRPRRYCSDSCRWRRGHVLAAQQAAARSLTLEELAAELAARTWTPGQ